MVKRYVCARVSVLYCLLTICYTVQYNFFVVKTSYNSDTSAGHMQLALVSISVTVPAAACPFSLVLFVFQTAFLETQKSFAQKSFTQARKCQI